MDGTTQATEIGSPAPLTYGIAEFAKVMGVSEDMARDICASEKHPPLIRVGSTGKIVRVIRSEVEPWLVAWAEEGMGTGWSGR